MAKSNPVKPIRTLHALKKHGLISMEDPQTLEQVIKKFSLGITPTMYEAMDLVSLDEDPIAKQFIPTSAELRTTPRERSDPIGDQAFTVIPGIIHRYPDRLLLTVMHRCAVYCRFCFRRENVGTKNGMLSSQELDLAYQYIRDHPAVWEVILSGGDPLILKPQILCNIIKKLDAIPHVEILRIHTRIPLVDPLRINEQMIQALSQRRPIYIVIHANHPNEFSKASIHAISRLADAGIPLLSQTVLLKDVNDNITVLSALMKTCIKNRIKPYYLHQGDLAKGTSHFRTTIRSGQKLMKQLRGTFSGIAQPTYVLDIPGGYGKVPIGPNYLIKEEEKEWVVEDFQGTPHPIKDE